MKFQQRPHPDEIILVQVGVEVAETLYNTNHVLVFSLQCSVFLGSDLTQCQYINLTIGYFYSTTKSIRY